jgi:hypothetical protein
MLAMYTRPSLLSLRTITAKGSRHSIGIFAIVKRTFDELANFTKRRVRIFPRLPSFSWELILCNKIRIGTASALSSRCSSDARCGGCWGGQKRWNLFWKVVEPVCSQMVSDGDPSKDVP